MYDIVSLRQTQSMSSLDCSQQSRVGLKKGKVMNTVLTETLSSGGLPVRASHNERSGIVESLYRTGSPVGSIWLRNVRLGLSVVLCWIGGLLYERSVCR